jgi:hypothetical protein
MVKSVEEQIRRASNSTIAKVSTEIMASEGKKTVGRVTFTEHNFILQKLMRETGSDEEDCEGEPMPLSPTSFVCRSVSMHLCAKDLLVVFDMDHTIVGDLVSLSDRDNVETSVPWVW